MHGDRDTLIDISGGRRTAELIPGARFELIEGMGHDYPPQLWSQWVDLRRFVRRLDLTCRVIDARESPSPH